MPLNLAISNIAWPISAEPEVLSLLKSHGVRGIEVAPTKLWTNPAEVAIDDVHRYRQSVESQGFRIVAAQALLFGRPDLTIFESSETRRRTLDYLDGIVRVCAEVGAEALVFGSPRNRQVGSLAPECIQQTALEFFGSLAQIAEKHGTTVVLEAIPPAQGADFVIRAAEAVNLVRAVGRPGLRLHLDTACMSLAGDDVEEILGSEISLLHHFHISEPGLAPIDQATIDHARFAKALQDSTYHRWLSIEMREVEPFSVAALDRAVTWAKQVYGRTGEAVQEAFA
jgi:sugar phosphate isomerase/epimerase